MVTEPDVFFMYLLAVSANKNIISFTAIQHQQRPGQTELLDRVRTTCSLCPTSHSSLPGERVTNVTALL